MAAEFASYSVRHTRIPRFTCNRIVLSFSRREPNWMNWRKIDYVKSHGLCIVDTRQAIPKLRARIRFTLCGTWKELVPRRKQCLRPIDKCPEIRSIFGA